MYCWYIIITMKIITTSLQNLISQSSALLTKILWQADIDRFSPFKAFLIKQLRIIFLAIESALQNKIFILAPALTFFSVLSIVPAAALALGVAKGFGLERYLKQQLQVALAGREAVLDWVIEITGTFFGQIDGGVVAIAGLGVLIYTIFMLLAIVEKIFNQIWQVESGRTILQRIRAYSAIIILGPFLLIAAGVASVFISTSIQLLDGTLFSPLLLFLLRLMPYLLIWILFTLLYKVMPNTRVNFFPALITGILAGTAFQLIQWAYLTFQIGAAGLGIVYGSFATVPLLLIWMQVSWMVVLFGAELAYAAQNIELYRYGSTPKNLSPYCYKLLSLSILSLLLKDYRDSSFPLTEDQVLSYLKIPGHLAKKILYNLREAELITATFPVKGSVEPVYFKPALDFSEITVARALEQLELHGHKIDVIADSAPIVDTLEDCFLEIQKLINESEANKLLVDL